MWCPTGPTPEPRPLCPAFPMHVGPHTSAGFAHLLWRLFLASLERSPPPHPQAPSCAVCVAPRPPLSWGPASGRRALQSVSRGSFPWKHRATWYVAAVPGGLLPRPLSGGFSAQLLTRVLRPRALRGLSTCLLPSPGGPALRTMLTADREAGFTLPSPEGPRAPPPQAARGPSTRCLQNRQCPRQSQTQA